jgi:hypothetical protein
MYFEFWMQLCRLKFKHQGSTAEKSALQKFNQSVCTDVSKYHPCLIFPAYRQAGLVTFFFQEKKVTKNILYYPKNNAAQKDVGFR